MEHNKNLALFKLVIYMAVLFRKAQIKRYQEIYLITTTISRWQNVFTHQIYFCKRMEHKQIMFVFVFLFQNHQEESAIVQKCQIHKIWKSYIDQYLIKQYFNFWTYDFRVIYGVTCTVMHQWFNKHLIHHQHFCHVIFL